MTRTMADTAPTDSLTLTPLWAYYRRTGLSEMRHYVPKEPLAAISVSAPDMDTITSALIEGRDPGGYVARNPKNHADQWYVAQAYFDENLEPADTPARDDAAELRAQLARISLAQREHGLVREGSKPAMLLIEGRNLSVLNLDGSCRVGSKGFELRLEVTQVESTCFPVEELQFDLMVGLRSALKQGEDELPEFGTIGSTHMASACVGSSVGDGVRCHAISSALCPGERG